VFRIGKSSATFPSQDSDDKAKSGELDRGCSGQIQEGGGISLHIHI
jgi:hypothetical protein